MSDTPRTIQEECYGTCWAACERIEELEAQVRAAANRIKRLEEAGDKMASAWDKEWLTEADIEAIIDDWHGAKEAKL